MKHLTIETLQYRYLEKSFGEWLDILGYAGPTVATLPVHVRELLHYLETQRKVTSIKAVTAQDIHAFLKYLALRPNQRQGGALSSSSINKTILAVMTFNRYLYTTGRHSLEISLRRLEGEENPRTILTKEEINELYEATYETNRTAGRPFGQRDRAMLAVFYGCGLRKNEGTRLDVQDLLTDRHLLHVRQGKGRKERLVPVTPRNMEYLTDWLEEGRDWFLEDHHQGHWKRKKGLPLPKKTNTDDEAFFLNTRGRRMQSGFYQRLDRLRERTEIEKHFGLHSLRHSIATHLLQAGMEIEDISRFLGHSTLESTQIYTHIAAEAIDQGRRLSTETTAHDHL